MITLLKDLYRPLGSQNITQAIWNSIKIANARKSSELDVIITYITKKFRDTHFANLIMKLDNNQKNSNK